MTYVSHLVTRAFACNSHVTNVTPRLAPVVFVLYLFLSFSTLFFYHDPL